MGLGVLILSSKEEQNMTNIIACVNQKGGTAKTTTTANLGIGLAQNGKRVLLIDTDPQGSLGISLAILSRMRCPLPCPPF